MTATRVEPALGLAAFGDLPLTEALAAGRRAGYRAFDLQLDSILEISRDERLASPAGRAQLRAHLDAEGLTLACVSNVRDCQLLLGPHGDQTAPIHPGSTAERRRHAQEAAARTIETAHELGAGLTRFFFGCPDFSRWFHWPRSHATWDDNLQALVDGLLPVLELARDAGVLVSLETHPKQVVYDLRTANRLLELLAADADGFGICVDPANLAAVGQDPLQFLRGLRALPLAVHLKDVEVDRTGLADTATGWATFGPGPAARFRVLGWGRLDWPQLMTVLAERGFTGPFVVEHEDLLLPRDRGVTAARHRAIELLTLTPPSRRWW